MREPDCLAIPRAIGARPKAAARALRAWLATAWVSAVLAHTAIAAPGDEDTEGARVAALPKAVTTRLERLDLSAVDAITADPVVVVVAENKSGEGLQSLLFFRDGKLTHAAFDPEGPRLPARRIPDMDHDARWFLHGAPRDLDGDGVPELHLTSYSGGAHCCTTHYLLRLSPALRVLDRLGTEHDDGVAFRDVPGYAHPLLAVPDSAFAYALGSFAESPLPVLALEVKEGKFRFASEAMKAETPGQCSAALARLFADWCSDPLTRELAETRARIAAAPKAKTFDELVDLNVGAVVDMLHRYVYCGHAAEGWKWLDGYWPKASAGSLRLFKRMYGKTLRGSMYFRDVGQLSSRRPLAHRSAIPDQHAGMLLNGTGAAA